MSDIFQTQIPYDPLAENALPGIAPLAPHFWLVIDDAYAGQMAERSRLIAEKGSDVCRTAPEATEAAAELLAEVVAHLLRDHTGFRPIDGGIERPDGVIVDLDGPPMKVLGRLVQNDFCILQKPEGAEEHILTAAILCFPANWRLEDKFLQPLTAIHEPVEDYDDLLARRVQRLFDGVQIGRPLWRFNALWYNDAALFQSGDNGSPRPPDGQSGRYLRSERQTIYRLPRSGAVVFGIHTFLLRAADLV